MTTRKGSNSEWITCNLGALLCGALALATTAIAMNQSYQFGWSLAVTEAGKQSMAMWMAIIDTCTAALPIAAVTLIRKGCSKSGKALFGVTIVYLLFSMTNQMGFALSEREAKAQQARVVNQAVKDARAERNKLIEGQLRWNNSTVVNRGAMRSSRKEAIASTERLINSVGEVDPGKIIVVPEDPQATGLASLSGATDRAVKVTLAIWAAVLVILAKPIFWGLAAFFYRSKIEVAAAKVDEFSDKLDGSRGSASRTSGGSAPGGGSPGPRLTHPVRSKLAQASQGEPGRTAHMSQVSHGAGQGEPAQVHLPAGGFIIAGNAPRGSKLSREQVMHLLGQREPGEPRQSTRSIARMTGWPRQTLDRMRKRLEGNMPEPHYVNGQGKHPKIGGRCYLHELDKAGA